MGGTVTLHMDGSKIVFLIRVKITIFVKLDGTLDHFLEHDTNKQLTEEIYASTHIN